MFSKEKYKKLVTETAEKSPLFRDCFFAFTVGGGICAAGEGFRLWLLSVGTEEKSAGLCVTLSLILLSALLTGIGVYDRIAKVAGAGTLVPVTGFANAVVSPALDTKSEGLLVGTGTKIFSVCGPVILYSTLAGGVYGLILFAVKMLGGTL